MQRSYRHISQYEDEIIELRSQGITKQKICESMVLPYPSSEIYMITALLHTKWIRNKVLN